MPEFQNAHELPVPFEQQQAQLESQYQRQRAAREWQELKALEKKLEARGYNIEELEKDNPHNQWMKNHDN